MPDCEGVNMGWAMPSARALVNRAALRRLGLSASVAIALAGCAKPESSDPQADEIVSAGGVAMIAKAPDGTVLWKVRDHGDWVYFASAGAQWDTTQYCGKNCWRHVRHNVPTASGTEAQRAETVKQGSVHDGPTAEGGDAQKDPS